MLKRLTAFFIPEQLRGGGYKLISNFKSFDYSRTECKWKNGEIGEGGGETHGGTNKHEQIHSGADKLKGNRVTSERENRPKLKNEQIMYKSWQRN